MIIFNLILDLLFKIVPMTLCLRLRHVTINLTSNDVFNILFLLFPYATIEIFCCGLQWIGTIHVTGHVQCVVRIEKRKFYRTNQCAVPFSNLKD